MEATTTEHGRISASTGIPTVLGWPDHESQWRGSRKPFEGREEEVAAIYATTDVEEARALLEKYGVSYVVVGPREESKYGRGGLDKFPSFMTSCSKKGASPYTASLIEGRSGGPPPPL